VGEGILRGAKDGDIPKTGTGFILKVAAPDSTV
jgi:hypothetical protein